jgi:hypothetical protein
MSDTDSMNSDDMIVYGAEDGEDSDSSEIQYGSDSDYDGMFAGGDDEESGEELPSQRATKSKPAKSSSTHNKKNTPISESQDSKTANMKATSSQSASRDKLRVLKELLDEGLISSADYDEQKNAVLRMLMTNTVDSSSALSSESNPAPVQESKKSKRERPKLVLPTVSDDDKNRFFKLYEKAVKKAHTFTVRKLIRKIKELKLVNADGTALNREESELATLKALPLTQVAEYAWETIQLGAPSELFSGPIKTTVNRVVTHSAVKKVRTDVELLLKKDFRHAEKKQKQQKKNEKIFALQEERRLKKEQKAAVAAPPTPKAAADPANPPHTASEPTRPKGSERRDETQAQPEKKAKTEKKTEREKSGSESKKGKEAARADAFARLKLGDVVQAVVDGAEKWGVFLEFWSGKHSFKVRV